MQYGRFRLQIAMQKEKFEFQSVANTKHNTMSNETIELQNMQIPCEMKVSLIIQTYANTWY